MSEGRAKSPMRSVHVGRAAAVPMRSVHVGRAAAVAALLLAWCAQSSAHGIHALAQGRSTRTAAQSRSDFLGVVQFGVTAGCSNDLTCGPSYCVRASNVAAANTRPNLTDSAYNTQLAQVTTRTCSISADPRCSASALAALFGRYPGVKAAYCNENWLVMHSNNLPNHRSFLDSIQTPPGDGVGGSYASQAVTRSYSLQAMTFKIPLSPQLLPAGVYTNNAGAIGFTPSADDLFSANGQTHMPSSGPAAYGLNGMPWFPDLNNQGGLTWPSCEVDLCNAHAGKGFDYHYHGDPFGPSCMYSCASYATLDAHPPLVGYGIDGVPIFGRYLSASAPGAATPLDDCGGHAHTGMGTTATAFPYVADGVYHYHAFVQTIAADGARASYTAYSNGPFMCFRANLSATPGIWIAGSPSASAAYGAGNLLQRADYAQVQPCTGMTSANVYLAKGFSIAGIAASGSFGDEGFTSTGAGSTGGACAAAAAAQPPPPPSNLTPSPSPSPSPLLQPGTTTYVAATVTLGGFTTTTFGSGEAAAFRTAVAAKTGASAASVTITSVANASPAGRRRTHGANDAVAVAFSVATSSSASAAVTNAAASIAVADFAAAGLTVSSVAVTSAPTATSTAPVDATATLPTTPTLQAVAAPSPAARAVLRGVALAAALVSTLLSAVIV